MFSETVPVIDLGSYFDGTEDDKRAVGRAVDAACRSLGFLVVSGHRVAPALIADIRAVSFPYFDLPTAEKLALRMPADRYRGYTPMLADNLAASLGEQSPPDLREAFSIGPVDMPRDPYHTARQAGTFFANNVWPARPSGMRDVYTRYYQAMEGLASSLMRVFALGLDLPEHFFDDKVNRHISNFSVLHYPCSPAAQAGTDPCRRSHSITAALRPIEGCRSGGAAGAVGRRRLDRRPRRAGHVCRDLGDLMQDWTGGRWRSTLHRVVNPPPHAGSVTRRMSMAFFHQPNYDTVIDTLPNCGAPDGAAMSARSPRASTC